MSDIKEVTTTAKSAFESFKKILLLLKDRRYFAASKEFFVYGKILYNNHLKGKYITIAGKKIPMTLAVLVTLFGLYYFYPNEKAVQYAQEIAEKAEIKQEMNSYNKDGIKIYNMRKCDMSVCGEIANEKNDIVDSIVVKVTFFSPTGIALFEGGVEATKVNANSKLKIIIPTEEDFAYFKLTEVIVE